MEKNSKTLEYLLNNSENIRFAFQPILDVKNNKIYGYEALMRPTPYTPMEFIEECAKRDLLFLVEEITNFNSVRQFMEAKLEGKLFINTFPAACMRLEKAKELAALGNSEMADRLVYEVLEYTQFESYVWNIKKLAFNMEGAHPLIAIDDYGTGFHIDKECIDFYKPDIVKLDRKFVTNIDKDPVKADYVEHMLPYLRKDGITILAEGVETEGEYEFYKNIGADLMQGYFIGKPMIYGNFFEEKRIKVADSESHLEVNISRDN